MSSPKASGKGSPKQKPRKEVEPEDDKNDENTGPKLEGEALISALRNQLEFYFSKQNLATDSYLNSQMDKDKFVPVDVIAGFRKVKQLTEDREILLGVMRDCKNLELNSTNTMVKANHKSERNTLILRDIPSDTPESEIRAIFDASEAGKWVSIRSDIGDTWFVTFENQDVCMDTCMWLTNQKFKGQPIRARVKSENTQRSFYYPPGAKAPSPTGGGSPSGEVDPRWQGRNSGGWTGPPMNGYYPQGVAFGGFAQYGGVMQGGFPQNNWQGGGFQPNPRQGGAGRGTAEGGQQPTEKRQDKKAKGDQQQQNQQGKGKKGKDEGKAQPGSPQPDGAAKAGEKGESKKKKSKTDKATPDGGTPAAKPSPTGSKSSSGGAKDKAKKPAQPELGPEHFPALPSTGAQQQTVGYSGPFISYTRQQMAEIVEAVVASRFKIPAGMNPKEDSVVLNEKPCEECQLLEPFPVMYPASPSPLFAAQLHHSSDIPFLDLSMMNPYLPAEFTAPGPSAASVAAAKPKAAKRDSTSSKGGSKGGGEGRGSASGASGKERSGRKGSVSKKEGGGSGKSAPKYAQKEGRAKAEGKGDASKEKSEKNEGKQGEGKQGEGKEKKPRAEKAEKTVDKASDAAPAADSQPSRGSPKQQPKPAPASPSKADAEAKPLGKYAQMAAAKPAPAAAAQAKKVAETKALAAAKAVAGARKNSKDAKEPAKEESKGKKESPREPKSEKTDKGAKPNSSSATSTSNKQSPRAPESPKKEDAPKGFSYADMLKKKEAAAAGSH